MEKIDLRKELKGLYNPPSKAVSVVDVPAFNFLMIDGTGDPNTSPAYAGAVEALYSLSYALKFTVKKNGTADYAVMPLEGLWWADDMSAFTAGGRSSWKWTMMIMQPELITSELVGAVRLEVEKKKASPALKAVRFERYAEGKAVQIMHLGPYAEEGPTVEKLHRFIGDNGWSLSGKHHEIYLGDPRKTAPANLKTVIRQPYR